MHWRAVPFQKNRLHEESTLSVLFPLLQSSFGDQVLPSDERSAGGPGGGEPSLSGSPGRPFLLYRQRHVFFSAGRKENVGLKQWVLKVATLMLVKVEETYASSTRNGYLLYALFISVGACGAVLSTGGKYPKTAGALRCAPDPCRFRYSGGVRPPGRSAKPPRAFVWRVFVLAVRLSGQISPPNDCTALWNMLY